MVSRKIKKEVIDFLLSVWLVTFGVWLISVLSGEVSLNVSALLMVSWILLGISVFFIGLLSGYCNVEFIRGAGRRVH